MTKELPAIVKGEVPAEHRDFYRPLEGQAGVFVANVAPVEGWALENVQGLKSALGKVLDEHGSVEKRLKQYGDLDPEAARTAMKKLDELLAANPEEKIRKEIEARTAQLTEKHGKELTQSKEASARLKGEIERLLLDSQIASACADLKGNPHLLRAPVREYCRVVEMSDGRFGVRVVDDAGTTRVSQQSGNSEPMTIRELLEGMRNDQRFQAAFQGAGSSGGGTPPGAGSNGAGGAFVLSREEAKDPVKYRNAKAQADKAGRPLQIAP